MDKGSWAKQAREASGLTPEDCASAIGKSRPMYDKRENSPGIITLDELCALFPRYSNEGKKVVQNYLQQFMA